MVTFAKLILPQWSPPSKGGSTRDVLEPGDSAREAAMEPAVEGREHCPHVHPAGVEPAAAMEPAVEGGSTWRAAADIELAYPPQWSPPLDGGSHPPRRLR